MANVMSTRSRIRPAAGPKANTAWGISIALLLISLVAWGYQLSQGLIVTDMRNPFSWGLYIATFAFFVGIAAGGLIVSSSVYLFSLEHLKPFTRIASLSAFASTLAAGAMVLPDMGRVDRIFNMFLHPNLQSPLIWDVTVITIYLMITFLSVYMQLLPDWKETGRGFWNGWAKGKALSEVQEFSRRWSKRMAMVGLPFAILIHTVTALIFATQASRDWWNTAVLPPDFIAVAVASGTALVLVFSLLVVGKDGFTGYQRAFDSLALIVAGSLAVHFFFVAVELLVEGWWGTPGSRSVLSLLFGQYAGLYAVEIILPFFTMCYFFAKKGRSSGRTLVGGCILLFIGVFAHRMMLMFPAFNSISLGISLPGMGIENWTYPVAVGQLKDGMPVFAGSWAYSPTLVEYAVALLPFGLVVFVVTSALKLYNFIPEKH